MLGRPAYSTDYDASMDIRSQLRNFCSMFYSFHFIAIIADSLQAINKAPLRAKLFHLECARDFSRCSRSKSFEINRSARCARLKFIALSTLKFRFKLVQLRVAGRILRRDDGRAECKRQRWDHNKLYGETRTTTTRNAIRRYLHTSL